MNGNIAKQLTDPQKNKEQFVHEMTEVYLLLENEFNHLVPSGAIHDKEFNISDMSAVRLKKSNNGTGLMVTLSVPEGTHIDLSLRSMENDKIEPIKAEFHVNKKFDAPSLPVILPKKKAEITADMKMVSVHNRVADCEIASNEFTTPELSGAQKIVPPSIPLILPNNRVSISANTEGVYIQNKIADYCLGAVNPEISYTDTEPFEYGVEYITDVLPTNIPVEVMTDMKEIAGDVCGYSPVLCLSPVLYPTTPSKTEFIHRVNSVMIDVAGTCGYEGLDIDRIMMRESVTISSLEINHIANIDDTAPHITDLFAASDSKWSIVVENIPAVLSSIPVKITSENVVSDVKAVIPIDRTVIQNQKPVRIPSPDTGSYVLNDSGVFKTAVGDVLFEIPSISEKIGVAASFGKMERAVREQKLELKEDSLSLINIHNGVPVMKIDKLKVNSAVKTIESVRCTYDVSRLSENTGAVTAVPLIEYKKIKEIPLPGNQVIHVDLSEVKVSDGGIVLEPSAKKSNIDVDRLEIPQSKVAVKTVQKAKTAIGIEGMIDVAKYIDESYESISTLLSAKIMPTDKSLIKTADSQPDIDISLPEIEVYSKDILNSLQRQINGA